MQIQFEYSNKEPDQVTSLGIDQSKTKVSRSTKKGIEIRILAFAKIKAKLELVVALEDRLRALQNKLYRQNETQIS